MTERAKRCGNCGAWLHLNDYQAGEGFLADAVKRPWGECRRRSSEFPTRDHDDWCLDWLPSEEA